MRAKVLAALLLGTAASAVAQESKATTHTVVVGARYGSSSFHRWLFGSGYRDLWTTPIQVEVLELGAFAGGLVPHKKGGGKQTKSLRFKGGDGSEWSFRSIDKDPSAVVPEGLRHDPVDAIVQDQISASMPAGVLVVDALSEAAGIPHAARRLVVMPDDPRLGEFRKEFAGVVGTFEERPRTKPPVTRGFEGFTELLDSDELQERADADPRDRVDARGYLRARLVDILVGDSDRHNDQWDWAREAGTGRFVAVPKDRDLAFVKFDGVIPGLARFGVPHLVNFDDDYPKVLGLVWQARFLDRRYLAELEWPAWEEVVRDLQARLTGPVIEGAARRLPPPYYARKGPLLAAQLKHRLEQLPAFARRHYAMLAQEVEVRGTHAAESVQLSRLGDGSVEVAVAGPEGSYFRRTLRASETREVRLFLEGGDDRAISEGRGSPGVKVRLVGGEGDDFLDDSAGGHTRLYDSSGEDRIVKGPGTKLDDHPYTPVLDANGHPARDWGAGYGVAPCLYGDHAYGMIVGVRLQRLGYGFRKHPYSHRHSLELAYSTRLETGDVRYEYQSLRTDSSGRFGVIAAGASGLELIGYYGFGNETTDPAPRDFYDVKQVQYLLAPSYRLDVTGIDVSLGPVLKYSATRLSPTSLVAQERPYGVDGFGQVGARLNLTVDHFDPLLERSMGALLSAEGSYYPPVWSASKSFGEVHGQFAAFVKAPIPLEPTLAVRVGGRKAFGQFPLHEAAAIGGRDTVRGLSYQRYTGDASAFGSGEFRLLLWRRDRSLLSRFGIFGLADAGRVFVKGESSDRWHTSYGGGAWLALIEPKNSLSVAVARSEGDVLVYLNVGRIF